MERVTVPLENRSYDIWVGSGLIAQAGTLTGQFFKRKRAVVVTDENVARHHLPELTQSLTGAGIQVEAIILPPGEQTKSFQYLEQLCQQLLEKQVERSDPVIAFGGGVIGDLTGFAAAILRRGVDFIQIPTTLLAQVDSSVGGKTGIDMPSGKNLVGAFHQPLVVLADTALLNTLSKRELLAGYAEVVKYGLIDEPEFFDWLEKSGEKVILSDGPERQYAVLNSVRAKARVVAADERESSGVRALLNLGHTFGHALETETGYGDALLHGEAVAIGMVMAFDLSAQLGFCAVEDATRVRRHLKQAGLPVTPFHLSNAPFSSQHLISHMRQDKKVAMGKLTFILAHGIGRAFVTQSVDEAVLAAFLDSRQAA